MQNSFLANVNIENVSRGMMQSIEVLEKYSKPEKYAIVASVFNCMFNNKMKGDRTVSDVMEIIDNIRRDCKLKKIPEFGGAENFIKGEL